MKFVQESIFSSSIRSFLKTFFGFAGILAVIIPLLLLISIISSKEAPSNLQAKLMPDANGKQIALNKEKPVILNISIKNIIGMNEITAEKIENILYESRQGIFENNRVKAILLDLNTPGGTSYDSNAIYKSLKKYSSQYEVPIYAYAEHLCASGGMYIAAAADMVFADELTLLGSIGAKLMPFMNFSEAMSKIGIQSETIIAGKNKDDMNSFRPWRDNESQSMQKIVNFYYDDFVNVMTSERPIDRKKLVQEYGANIFPATKALKIGYIDSIAQDRETVISALAKTAGLEEYSVVSLEYTSWKKLLENKSAFSGKILGQLGFAPEQSSLTNRPLYLYP